RQSFHAPRPLRRGCETTAWRNAADTPSVSRWPSRRRVSPSYVGTPPAPIKRLKSSGPDVTQSSFLQPAHSPPAVQPPSPPEALPSELLSRFYPLRLPVYVQPISAQPRHFPRPLENLQQHRPRQLAGIGVLQRGMITGHHRHSIWQSKLRAVRKGHAVA